MKRALVVVLVAACGAKPTAPPPVRTVSAPLSLAADAHMIAIPAGRYIAGSTPEEREAAYIDYEATAKRDAARAGKWFDGEPDRHVTTLPAFRIDLMPVTNAEYAELVATGGAPAPTIDAAACSAQGFSQDFATQVARFTWRDGRPPPGREDHPVVLVTWSEAAAYCAWRGAQRGEPRRLPTADEYEKAARGSEGAVYPWGGTFEASKLDSAVAGPGDTMPVGSFPSGASPFGVLDLAGNVFAWTATPLGADKVTVKGSAWDDFAGVGRGASRHGRGKTIRHAIVGFRCAADGA